MGFWFFCLFSSACLCLRRGARRRTRVGFGHSTSGAGSVGCASVCVWDLLPPSRAHLWQEARMTSCSGTLLAFDLEFPAMDNVFGNTRARLRSCRGGRCGCLLLLLLLVPVFPSWLLPTAPGFPLFRVPPGRFSQPKDALNGAKPSTKRHPPIPLFPGVCGLSWFFTRRRFMRPGR